MKLSKGILASVDVIRREEGDYSYLKVELELSTTIFRMTEPEMEAFADELKAEAARLRKVADDKLNARVDQLDANAAAA